MTMRQLNRSNIEIKCKVVEFDTLRARLVRLGGKNVATLIQRDVYYGKQQQGTRKKLRIITGGDTELITYRRPDEADVRTSQYHVHKVKVPLFCHAYHKLRFGIDVVVDKKRELWKWQSVRIHFDLVKDLGRYVELEVVVEEAGSEKTAREQCNVVIETLKLPTDAFIGGSYSDLIRS